jgi:hypothetical protein
MEQPGLQIAYRNESSTATLSGSHKAELHQLFLLIVQNLAKDLPADVRKFLELFAV